MRSTRTATTTRTRSARSGKLGDVAIAESARTITTPIDTSSTRSAHIVILRRTTATTTGVGTRKNRDT